MYESLDPFVDALSVFIAFIAMGLVLNNSRMRFNLSPKGYIFILISFVALFFGASLEGLEHFFVSGKQDGPAEIIGHLLTLSAIGGFALGFLHWMPTTERLSREIELRKNREDELKLLALHDQLTGLVNRHLFYEHVENAFQHTKRHGSTFAILAIDLDEFKMINDRFGHQKGDLLLQDVANRLRKTVRGEDIVARFSGDEFFILASVASADQAAFIAQRIIKRLDDPSGESGIASNCSVGITMLPKDGDDSATIVKHADFALYKAKSSGKGCYHFFDSREESQVMMQQRRLEELKAAVTRGQLLLYFQPIIDINAKKMIGVETLLRWQHPEEGLLSPAGFVQLAEKARMAHLLDYWVIENACRQGADWQKQGLELRMSVNVSAQSINHRLLDVIGHALEQSGLKPALLELEITETSLLDASAEEAKRVLNQVSELGVDISIDDFGAGYGSLVYLNTLPVNTIKIDRQFTQAAPSQQQAAAIVSATKNLGASLGLRVVFEGIESEIQLAFLKKHGCEIAQGYWFSPPIPAENIGQFIDNLALKMA